MLGLTQTTNGQVDNSDIHTHVQLNDVTFYIMLLFPHKMRLLNAPFSPLKCSVLLIKVTKIPG